VVPGINSAFLDLGLSRTAFLFGDDIMPSSEIEWEKDTVFMANLYEILKEGQEILVQVIKEPLGNKGARVSTNLTLPGHYLVYVHSNSKVYKIPIKSLQNSKTTVYNFSCFFLLYCGIMCDKKGYIGIFIKRIFLSEFSLNCQKVVILSFQNKLGEDVVEGGVAITVLHVAKKAHEAGLDVAKPYNT
jgi:hypothetical protein